jgi:hypothetical protein
MKTPKETSLLVVIFSVLTLGTTLSSDSSYITNTHIKSITFSQIFDQNALGQSVPQDFTAKRSSTNYTDNPEETFYRQGIISSFKSGPNETAQVAPILTHRSDDMIYSGVLTYSSTSPVEIAFLNKINIDNSTILSQIVNQFGKSSPHWIDLASSSIHNLTKTTPQIIGGIQPEYGTSTPYYSASIPFVSGGVGLWSAVGEPFLVSYQLSAKLVHPEIVNHIALNSTE